MSKKIEKSNYDEGLRVCEKNGLEFNLYARNEFSNRKWRWAYLYGVISFEEFVKCHMILDSYNKKCISYSKWKNKMTQHLPKIDYGVNLLNSHFDNLISDLLKNGVPAQNILKNINIGDVKKFIKNVLDKRTSFVYVGYDFDNNCWIPAVNTFKLNEVKEIIEAAASLWVLFHNRINKLNIITIPFDQYKNYFYII